MASENNDTTTSSQWPPTLDSKSITFFFSPEQSGNSWATRLTLYESSTPGSQDPSKQYSGQVAETEEEIPPNTAFEMEVAPSKSRHRKVIRALVSEGLSNGGGSTRHAVYDYRDRDANGRLQEA
ncbi:hypothetical protein L198_07899 [Cryptococcus wingfieldii CBS 7118]|uniref:Uncharacterized protein n=1 Tax=Cryptococcus wingfieldii CBS 7118 TaxID=1295528 RepID=A0A1E3HS16_9TREE|nr:hypothetical protein L198_07899 [Cryptococcus wingfieldii CBS 7118]ODN79149.1 hypothetical protein L198_07899 [Cryptococcus wingfieldii CBS 7118]